jgi:hypothetical protein
LCYYTSEMACPFFHPSAPLVAQSGAETAMYPLGDCWTGECRAGADAVFTPEREQLRTVCNFGYARGGCERFPGGDGADAVRFTISRDDGASIGIYYVMERDHHPYAHGPLEYSRATGGFGAAAGDELRPLAEAYIASYLRRKHD